MYKNENGTLRLGRVITHAVIGIVVLSFLFGLFGTVDSGERGVKLRMNKVIGTVEPGLYFKLPYLDTVKKIDVRTQSVVYERENPLASASQDLQDVNIATVTNYHLDPTKVMEVYTQYQTLEAFEEQVIRPAVRDTVKAMASGFVAGDLVTRRAEFASKVAATLNERLADTPALVEQSNITDIQFSPSFTKAIEEKVTAEQNALASKNKLEQTKYEAEQRIAQARGEAEAIKIQSQAINSQGGADYVNLKAIEKWDGRLPTQFVPGSAVPFLNLK